MQKSPTTLKHFAASDTSGDTSPDTSGDEIVPRHKGKINSMYIKTKEGPISKVVEETDIIFDVSDTIATIAPTVHFQDICSAAFRINDGIFRTPCEKSRLSDSLGCEVYFKKEYMQVTGSVKDRPARHILMLLNDQQRASGVIAACEGNFAVSMAYHGQKIGIPLTIVVPLSTPVMKIHSCKTCGADVIICGRKLKHAKEHAIKLSKEKGFHYVDSFDHPLTITGSGTIGLEIIEQVPEVDIVIVPVGSGALIAGVALAVKTLKPSVKIIGVESETCPNFSLSLEAGRPVTLHPEVSIANELIFSEVGRNAFNIAAPLVDKVNVTREDYIALAVLRMAEKEKTLIEGSGACALAALLSGDLGDLTGKKIVACLTEANMNTPSYGRCLDRGLAVDGRLLKVSVAVPNEPGAVLKLTEIIEKMEIGINSLTQENDHYKTDVYSVLVEIICDSRDAQHALMLEKELKNNYSQVSVDANFDR